MSIRVRLALSGVAVAGLALLLFGFGLDRLVVRGADQEQDRLLADRARRAVTSVRQADRATLESGPVLVADDVATSTEPFVVVLDEQARVIYTSARLGDLLSAVPAALREQASRDGSATARIPGPAGTLAIHVRPWRRADPQASGLVIVGQSVRVARKQVTDFRAFLTFSGMIALLVAGLATWVVSGRALQPLKQLAATANEIGSTGDLDRRLPDRRSKDIMGVLTVSFNGMLDRLREAQVRREDALEAQRRFVADASHELRNPLTTVRSNASFLLGHPEASTADRQDALRDISTAGERIALLVDDLLTLARADAGQPLERRPVELGAILAEVARGARWTDRPFRLSVSEPVVALGDPAALHRLVTILVDNAVRHGAGEIWMSVGIATGMAVLSVSDRGPGIQADELDRIFDRFYQADQARSNSGTGLGLSIARSLAAAHSGSIHAASRPDGGAVFTVALPLAVGYAAATTAD